MSVPDLTIILGMTESIGKRAKRLRARRKLTQLALAHEASVDPSTITRLENDKRSPDTATLQRIAAALGVSTQELLGTEDVATTNDAVYPSLAAFLDLQADVREEERAWLLSQRFAEGLGDIGDPMWWYAQLRGYRLLRHGATTEPMTPRPDVSRPKRTPRRA